MIYRSITITQGKVGFKVAGQIPPTKPDERYGDEDVLYFTTTEDLIKWLQSGSGLGGTRGDNTLIEIK